MRAGKLNKRVIIERKTETRGDYGEAVDTWATLKTVWAGIKPTKGQESVQGGRSDATVTHEISMRNTDVTQGDRISHKARIFNIEKVLDKFENGVELTLECVEDV